MTSPRAAGCALGSGAADDAGVAGDDQGGGAPAEGLEEPAAGGDPLAGGRGGVEVAAGPDVGLDQRQAEVDVEADLFDGGARAALIGASSCGAGRVGAFGASGDVPGVNLAVFRGARSLS